MQQFQETSEPAMSRPAQYKFRLFIAGDAHNSAQAVANLAALCREHLLNRHDVEIVDVFRQPKRALAEGIFMTPTLVKLAPSPAPKKIVGTLSQTGSVLHALGLGTIAG
jgi:circadian clock protein KaiB